LTTVSYDIVVDANYLKFTKSEQAKALTAKLLSTGNREIGEASRRDATWGMGCTAETASSRGYFQGKNLLGKAIQEVRSMLEEEREETTMKEGIRRRVLGG
jgi:ribA/ribD-fused uncharacterized protein